MFKENDYVIYMRSVCRVKGIKKNKVSKEDYYVLIPIDDESLTISIPIENKLGFIRSLISKKEVESIIDNIKNIDVIIVDNDKNIESEYKKLLERGTHEDLIKIIKTSYLRNKSRIDSKKKIREKDDTYLKMAEKTLYNEFSIVLNKSYDDTLKYVVDKVNKSIGKSNE